MLKAIRVIRQSASEYRPLWRNPITNHAVAMTWIIAAVMFMVAACDHRPVMPHATFIDLPVGGWQRSLPLTFEPQYDDSLAHYALALALRHDITYPYRNLSMVVDIIAADSTIDRRHIDVRLSDEYGNWMGGGFGALYQNRVQLTTDVLPAQARSVIVWQAMQDIDTLVGVNAVGIIASPI